MGKAGSVLQTLYRQIFRSAELNDLTAELGADPIIGHSETDGTRCDFDIGSPISGAIGHVTKHIYQRDGYKIKTLDAAGTIVHSVDITSINTIDIPIGGIIWWYKNLTGVPALPSGWVECNGQVLDDSESLLNGQTIPNINGSGYFIRGSATAGITQLSQTKSHNHTAFAQNGATVQRGSLFGTDVYCGTVSAAGTQWGFKLDKIMADGEYTVVDGSKFFIGVNYSTIGSPDESRPVNISMVAIMRVK
jgi:hypothetical protein